MGGIWRRKVWVKVCLSISCYTIPAYSILKVSTCPFCQAQRWHTISAQWGQQACGCCHSLLTNRKYNVNILPPPPWHSFSQVKHILKSRRTGTCDGSGTAHCFLPNNYGDRTLKKMKGLVRLQRRLWRLIPARCGSSKWSRTSQTRTGLRFLQRNELNQRSHLPTRTM